MAVDIAFAVLGVLGSIALPVALWLLLSDVK